VEAQRLRAMLAAELDRVRGSAAEIASIKQGHTASGRLLTTMPAHTAADIAAGDSTGDSMAVGFNT